MKKVYLLLMALCLFTTINAQIINFPDVNFKTKLLAASPTNQIAKDLNGNYFKIDANSNSEIELNEALNVMVLDVSNLNSSPVIKISDVTGLTSFSNLIQFYCYDNLLTTLDLTPFTNLETIGCDMNHITTLNVSGLDHLGVLMCFRNQISYLDLNNKSELTYLNCAENNLSSLDLSDLVNLTYCDVNNNNLTSLDFTGLINIETVQCFYNNITSLDVSQQSHLQTLMCGHNLLLQRIFMKNGSIESGLNLEELPNLEYVCVDNGQLTTIQNHINLNGSANCSVNTYCTFAPGGEFFTIQGNSRYDFSNDGCNVSDFSCPNLKFSLSDGITTGLNISSASGNYSIPVQQGTHTITPILENPGYFNVSPSVVSIQFPAAVSPYNQNFCLTANGVHPDLEVTLLPLNPARPGFDAKYRMVYKNKGNQMQSGSVNLVFNDAVLDLISANPVAANQTVNNLSWDFTNLQPFETREITVTLNVNSPTETPAVNTGDILNYTATITSASMDETPDDNTIVFNQTVVNSFDPNDKTCLEGATISPSEVGKYVHYMIRFENTGTFPAENIVVKDMVDTNKFDINSLVPIKGSHSFVTNITSGNKVEFIFENINLPFDDANNDGYVAFKIKTKPTLVNGDTFSNSANIYFDYNFPIVTNTATTTIAALSTQDFGFGQYFSLYPNPVKDVLNIETKQTIEVTSINIYNQLGQLVLVVPNAQNVSKVDVSNLASGNYFIKINSDKGTSNTKFIKQ